MSNPGYFSVPFCWGAQVGAELQRHTFQFQGNRSSGEESVMFSSLIKHSFGAWFYIKKTSQKQTRQAWYKTVKFIHAISTYIIIYIYPSYSLYPDIKFIYNMSINIVHPDICIFLSIYVYMSSLSLLSWYIIIYISLFLHCKYYYVFIHVYYPWHHV